MQVFLYILASSKNPWIEGVPWEVDAKQVFFGPCKKRLRTWMRNKYLQGRDYRRVTDDVWFVGLRGASQESERTILWVGRLTDVMTFAAADKRLRGPRYSRMRNHRDSQLHVTPIFRNGQLVGYENTSGFHAKNHEWALDLVSKVDHRLQRHGNRLLVRRPGAADVFDRDACALLESVFFAKRERPSELRVDDELAAILRHAQPTKKKDVDKRAVFGLRRDGSLDGLTGRYLLLEGSDASAVVSWLCEHVPKSRETKRLAPGSDDATIYHERRSKRGGCS